MEVQLSQTDNSLYGFRPIKLVIPYGPKVTLGYAPRPRETLLGRLSGPKALFWVNNGTAYGVWVEGMLEYEVKRFDLVHLSTSVKEFHSALLAESNDASNLCFEEWLFKSHNKDRRKCCYLYSQPLYGGQDVSSSLLHRHTHVLTRWKSPHESTIKLNVDACFSYTSKKSCSGFIIRDSAGFILGSGFIHNTRITSVFMAETTAILQGVQFVKDIGFTRITLEGDSKKTIQKLNESTIDLSDLGLIIRDIKSTARTLTLCSFVFIGGNGNRAAHAMALEGSRLSSYRFTSLRS
ncbi:hypothetical protein F3Y22_tig00111027pilonHSYRG00008 [Hibiscus syriacus]|uniref:RNase H type-1 domain-containing protein n=1 Tax=Hibiscus syriacus TaxID=106335 RepID=A0A6A2Z5A4_HIBSY|nr:hypothetical protein F3Y22_tig00111027pilonHSYRG00008 [Hibiscus syriacus]